MILATGLLFLAVATTAFAKWPVIGCDDGRYSFPNHYLWQYAPHSCTTSGATEEGFTEAHWHGWGHGRAWSVVRFSDARTGEWIPATVTVSGLFKTHESFGTVDTEPGTSGCTCRRKATKMKGFRLNRLTTG